MPTNQRLGTDDREDLQDRWKPAIQLDEEPAIAVCEFDAPAQLAPQNDQLMSERGIFGLKPDFGLEWRGQGGQCETQKPDHSASLGDSVTPSTRIGFSVHTGSALHDPRPRSDLRHRRHTPIAHHGQSRQAHCTSLTLAEWLCRTADRIDPARVFGSRHCLGPGTSAPNSEKLCGLLQWRENASVSKQRCAGLSAGSAIRRHKLTRPLGRTSSPLRSGLSFRYTQAGKWLNRLGSECGRPPPVPALKQVAGTRTTNARDCVVAYL